MAAPVASVVAPTPVSGVRVVRVARLVDSFRVATRLPVPRVLANFSASAALATRLTTAVAPRIIQYT